MFHQNAFQTFLKTDFEIQSILISFVFQSTLYQCEKNQDYEH